MTRYVSWVIVLLASPVGSRLADAQVVRPRSADYLFITNVSDARALMVNPAGLAVFPEASLLGEIVVDRALGDTRISQLTAGLNSRGFSLSFQRNLFPNDSANNVLRFGTGFAFPRGALGVAFSMYMVPGDNARDADVGLVYGLLPGFDVGAVIQHIGRPLVDSLPVPLTFVGGGQWTAPSGLLQVNAQASAAERRDERSGIDMEYRAGGRLILPIGRIPISLLTSLDIASDLDVTLFHVGISVGGRTNGTALTSFGRRDGSPFLERYSVTGIASNPLAGR